MQGFQGYPRVSRCAQTEKQRIATGHENSIASPFGYKASSHRHLPTKQHCFTIWLQSIIASPFGYKASLLHDSGTKHYCITIW